MLVNMCEMLKKARTGKYGIGFFNAVNVEMARAVIETAEKVKSPVIIGTAEVLLPYMELKNVADYLIPMAKRASVPVCVHYDHGLTYERCIEAADLGFTSIMYDCSTLPFKENMQRTADMVKLCHEREITVEGELGHVGDNFGAGKLNNPSDYFTDPQKAVEFAKCTGVDALAIAVGNAHGDYAFPPKLDFERINNISKAIGIPLVLHGGSGLSAADFKQAISCGICKINIFTDIDKAGKNGAVHGIDSGSGTLTGLMQYIMDEMKKVVEEKIILFGSGGKA